MHKITKKKLTNSAISQFKNKNMNESFIYLALYNNVNDHNQIITVKKLDIICKYW